MMQVFPTRKSDAEFVEAVRKVYRRTSQGKWFLIAILGVVMAGSLLMGFFSIRMQSQLFRLVAFPGATNEISYMLGFIGGFITAFSLAAATPLIMIMLGELRTWRLLLDYHDCLDRAGLLSGDSAREQSSP